ncbi:hypothetical protein JV173_00510 [Acholeplasma equirhinis]|uniref:hypothetical protein n=1 Tax=Acholeplasma equirhinis TaxID=555393 RepID=UPI00197A7B1A|nr:hypothetical protein [Acholeplasma equirhinis]MBN3489985.1 hypothetical protein [Acholeplasma equirhinis]
MNETINNNLIQKKIKDFTKKNDLESLARVNLNDVLTVDNDEFDRMTTNIASELLIPRKSLMKILKKYDVNISELLDFFAVPKNLLNESLRNVKGKK